MNPLHRKDRKRRHIRLEAESLETRELMTGGAGNTFAIIPGTISTAGGTAAITFTIDPAHFTLPKGLLSLGVDVVPQPGSGLKPLISEVDDPHGKLIPQTFHSIYDPHLSHYAVASGQGTSAVLTPVGFYPQNPNRPATYKVVVTAEGKTSGNFLLGFYLPGDANGDGTVNQADLQATRAAYGSRPGNPKYNFNADVNRDGRIGKIDLATVRQNMGITVNIVPTVAANLDPASDTGLQDRVTAAKLVHFTGTTTPGASVTYSENGNLIQPVTATADNLGNYSILVPLGNGVNHLHVMTMDAFGQSISGDIAPVTYSATAPIALISQMSTATPQSGTTPKK